MATAPSLFGASPELIQQQRAADIQAQAEAASGRDINQQVRYSDSINFNRLGDRLGGLLGGQDPAMQQYQKRQSVLQGVDLTSAVSLFTAAQKAATMGDYEGASQLTAKAQEIQAASTKNRLDDSTIQKNLSEKTTPDMKNASAVADTVAERGTPEWNKAYATRLQTLTTPAGQVLAYGTDTQVLSKAMFNKDFAALTQEQAQAVSDRKEFNSRTVAKSGATPAAIQEGAFAKGLGGGQATAILESKTSANDARQILETNQVGRSLLDSGALTGTGANFFVSLNNGLKQAGVDFGFADSAANSQAFAAAMGANVGRVVKQFGAGTAISDGDRKYAAQVAAGEITVTETALRRILDINDRASRSIINRHNESVKGIQTNIPLRVEMPAAAPPPPPSSASRIPSQSVPPQAAQAQAAQAPIYAKNSQTGERRVSTDGGATWTTVR
jgi:hypothetical protein